MTKDEQQMQRATVEAIDTILRGLSEGRGIFEWEDLMLQWFDETEELRVSINKANDADRDQNQR